MNPVETSNNSTPPIDVFYGSQLCASEQEWQAQRHHWSSKIGTHTYSCFLFVAGWGDEIPLIPALGEKYINRNATSLKQVVQDFWPCIQTDAAKLCGDSRKLNNVVFAVVDEAMNMCVGGCGLETAVFQPFLLLLHSDSKMDLSIELRHSWFVNEPFHLSGGYIGLLVGSYHVGTAVYGLFPLSFPKFLSSTLRYRLHEGDIGNILLQEVHVLFPRLMRSACFVPLQAKQIKISLEFKRRLTQPVPTASENPLTGFAQTLSSSAKNVSQAFSNFFSQLNPSASIQPDGLETNPPLPIAPVISPSKVDQSPPAPSTSVQQSSKKTIADEGEKGRGICYFEIEERGGPTAFISCGRVLL